MRCAPNEVGRRSAGSATAIGRRRPLRGLYRATRETREENPPQRVRERRRLVSHRRPDAQGRSRAFSISSTASATRSAGRARTSPPRKSRRRSRRFPGVAEANVYGVAVPGTEGRAGMAAIVLARRPRSRGVSQPSAARCRRYARPLFLRDRPRHRNHRHLQAQEKRSCGAKVTIPPHRRPTLFRPSAAQRLRAARPDAVDEIRARRNTASELRAQAVAPASTVSTVPEMFGLVAEQILDRVGHIIDVRNRRKALRSRDLLALRLRHALASSRCP